MNLKELFQKPLGIMTTKQNIIIIQIHPKKRLVSVSYKGRVKTAYFNDNTLKNTLKGGIETDSNIISTLTPVAQLLKQLIQEQ